ncbi:pre-mRNA-splicing factor cwc22-like isoform X2 [Hordeum vulgare subsp. vulgare]|uniref:pre-mRNA-splicing factor cwc22-like isoform X2 n=1 Tax=Hordeum vulgare subsp. vulgare TaxID=112509 RepID=UPI001D1A4CE1|nr:pre-mRNA-splicing factor cwc22-like isoform X2 [Hordeum vulgare subsp. vulgare]KAI5013171.1 hypothetical protein ZWY2020_028125 [Hordeum vulgare]
MSSTTSDQERHCHGRPQAVAALEAVSFVARVTKSLDMPKTELAFAGHGQQQLRVRAINSSRDQKLSTARRSTCRSTAMPLRPPFSISPPPFPYRFSLSLSPLISLNEAPASLEVAVATSCSQSGQNGSESIPTPRSAAMSPRLRPQPCRRSRLAPVRSCQGPAPPANYAATASRARPVLPRRRPEPPSPASISPPCDTGGRTR